MQARKGFYYIVQFCPDPGRAEAANVGVVLFVPSDRVLEVKLDASVKRIQQCFGRDAIDSKWFKTVRELFENGLRRRHAESPFREPEDLDRYFGTLGNQIIVTRSRVTRVENPMSDLRRLYWALVRSDGSEAEHRRERQPRVPAIARPLDAAIRGLQERNIEVHFEHSYEIPGLPQPTKVDYTIQNGALHLIKLLRLRDESQHKRAIESAVALATKGRLIAKHSKVRGHSAKLVLVAAPSASVEASTASELDTLLRNLKRDFEETTWIGSTEIPGYAESLASMEH